MYYTIVKSICDDLELSYYYGEGWLQNYESLNATYPAVFMFNIIETYNDFPNESNYKTIDLGFAILKRIDQKDWLNPNSLTNDTHVQEMRAKLYLFLKKLRDYKNTAGIPIFNTGEAWQIKVTEETPQLLSNDFVAGVRCEMKIKVLNTESVC
jgi:hypothetical protein